MANNNLSTIFCLTNRNLKVFLTITSFIIITGILIIARLFGEAAGWRTSMGFSIIGVIMFTAAAGIIFYAGTSAKRIVGGSVTSISQYPLAAAMLLSPTGGEPFSLGCGGSIINNRAILTAAHCFDNFPFTRHWRVRVGSSNFNSSGVVVTTNRIIWHSSYNRWNLDNDIAILRINGGFSFNNNVRPGSIAGSNYNLPDGAPVWIVGWGAMWYEGPPNLLLQHVQVWVVNQAVCRSRYAERRVSVTDNMMCSGYLDVGGRDGCQGDSGGPVLHNNVIVGIMSWGADCGHPRYPGVNARVSRYTSWIQSNQ